MLPRRQVDGDSPAGDLFGHWIQRQITGRQNRWTFLRAAPDQRAKAGQQRRVGEGLGQEVVGAGVQRLDLVPLPSLAVSMMIGVHTRS